MSLYPAVLRKAQAELDTVVGRDRLPDFSDRPHLVYVNAIIKEALRWQNVIPLGVPHRLTQDDEFNGYFIPKGTLILPNIWLVPIRLTLYIFAAPALMLGRIQGLHA